MEAFTMTIVKPYTKAWAKAYKRETKVLNSALSGARAKLYHVGATAVKGAAARPIIDIMITVTDVHSVTEEIMRGVDYTPLEAVFGASAVYEKQGDGVAYRVLVYSADNEKDIAAHLDVKEYLLQNKKERKAYSRKKLQCAADENYEAAMAEYKNQLVLKIVKTAIVMKSRTLYIPVCTAGGLVLGGLIGSFASGAFIGGVIGVLSGFIAGFVLSIVMAKRGKNEIAASRAVPKKAESHSVPTEAQRAETTEDSAITKNQTENNA